MIMILGCDRPAHQVILKLAQMLAFPFDPRVDLMESKSPLLQEAIFPSNVVEAKIFGQFRVQGTKELVLFE